MGCFVSFRDDHIKLSNRNFDNAISFAIETGQKMDLSPADEAVLARFAKEVENGEYWPGRGINIEDDIPELDEQKLWARVYLDTARAILDGEVGSQSNRSWQTRMIFVTYSIAQRFLAAVYERDRMWRADTKDAREEAAFLKSLRDSSD